MAGALTIVTLGIGPPVHATPPSGQPGGTPPALGEGLNGEGAGATVTLITGDLVHLQDLGDGRITAVVSPAPRASGLVPQFAVSERDGATYVVPSDVSALIPDRLDSELFNVTSLVAQGFDDASSDTLPVILTYPEARPLRAESVPAAEDSRQLPSVDAVAVSTDKSRAAEFGAALGSLAATTAGGTAARAAAGPLAEVGKVWLDRRVHAQLDRSAAQIGAPAVWEAGFDGSGVTVAVLDTGIDATHPDLAGKVREARNFTSEEDPRDAVGHGTHVASIVAGSGAASGGQRRGVAPGAELLDGRVLDSFGEGVMSWVIAGLEWAVEQDADIVNLSLGAHPASVDAPLVTEAVERLSAEHDTLFVVAAGNFGCAGCIASPADATSALAVGAVDRDGALADFSSRGPTADGYGLKPDVTAPGVGIVAARAEGAPLEGEGPYVEMSGTSMAAPHVAGAAALLAQARPDLDPAGLRATLTATAVPTAGLSWYEQGAGRVAVDRALDSPVMVSHDSLDFGFFPWPRAGVPRQSRELTYRNASDEPVTLRLTAEVADAGGNPAGVLAVEPATLTLAPGEPGTATLSLDVAAATPGVFTGLLRAEGPDGLVLTSPVGFAAEEEMFDVTVRAVARDGRPARPWGHLTASIVVDVETGDPMYAPCLNPPAESEMCVRVPAGTYSALAFVYTKPAWAESDGDPFTTTPLHSSLVGDPELTVDDDLTLVLDARDAVEVAVDTPDHDATANLGGAAVMSWSRTAANGVPAADFLLNSPGAQLEERFFMQPMAPVTVGEFVATTRWRLGAPALTLEVSGGKRIELDPRYYRPDTFSDNSWQYPMLEGRARLRVVDAGLGRPEDLSGVDLDGALALIQRSDELSVAEQSNRAAEAGAALVAIFNDVPGVNDATGPPGVQLRVPTVRLSHAEGTALLSRLERGRRVTVTAKGTPASPYRYDLVYAERDGIPSELRYVADTGRLARVDRELHSQLTGSTYTEVSWPFEAGSELAVATQYPVWQAPERRTDYYLPDPRTTWEHGVFTPQHPYNYHWPRPEPQPLRLTSPPISYDVGRYEQSWFGQPLVPGFDADRPVTRTGDVLAIPIAGLVDAGGNFGEAPSWGIADSFDAYFRIWHGDEVIGETRWEPSGTLELSPDPETYRITYEIGNNTSWARLSTRTSTEWTFQSGHTEAERPVPLLSLDYDLPVDLANRATGRKLEISVGHQPGVDIPAAGLALWVSYNDGATWRRLPVRSSGKGDYTAYLPRGGKGFVSFRVEAADAEGNRIEQEVIRATTAWPARGYGPS